MTDDTANLILTLLRDLRSDMITRFNQIRDDIADLKHRVSSLEQQVAGLRMDLAHYSLRQDQYEERLRRIERRLELRDSEFIAQPCEPSTTTK